MASRCDCVSMFTCFVGLCIFFYENASEIDCVRDLFSGTITVKNKERSKQFRPMFCVK